MSDYKTHLGTLNGSRYMYDSIIAKTVDWRHLPSYLQETSDTGPWTECVLLTLLKERGGREGREGGEGRERGREGEGGERGGERRRGMEEEKVGGS